MKDFVQIFLMKSCKLVDPEFDNINCRLQTKRCKNYRFVHKKLSILPIPVDLLIFSVQNCREKKFKMTKSKRCRKGSRFLVEMKMEGGKVVYSTIF